MSSCTGSGQCLELDIKTNQYTKPFVTCRYECKPVVCPNAVLCWGDQIPQYELDDYKGVCRVCYGRYGGRVFISVGPGPCNWCNSVDIQTVSIRGCHRNHKLCLNCFWDAGYQPSSRNSTPTMKHVCIACQASRESRQDQQHNVSWLAEAPESSGLVNQLTHHYDEPFDSEENSTLATEELPVKSDTDSINEAD